MAPLAVEGLDELVRAFQRVNKSAVRNVRKQLRVGVGGAFVRDAKERVADVGLVGKTGRLRRSIRPAVRGSTLVVRSSPPLNPGPRSAMGYAAIYEYGGRRVEGGRPFLNPTLDEWQSSGKLEESFNGFLDEVEREYRA